MVKSRRSTSSPRIGFEVDVLGTAAVQVIVIAAEGGDLHLVEDVAHQHHAEMRAHPAGAREQSMMRSGRASVAISKSFGLTAEQQVADAAAHQIGLMARAAQLGDYAACKRFRYPPSYANM